MISICYITSRIQPMVRWFADSLAYQTSASDKEDIELIFIDLLLDSPKANDRRAIFTAAVDDRFKFRHVAPKPNVWQGMHRVVSQNWFAASNARNTGLVLAEGEQIAFIDDLSVLTGTWFLALKEAARSGRVTCGAYRKVTNLRVDNGNITYFDTANPVGIDNRFAHGNDAGPVPCHGHWLYGCSFTLPTQWLIGVNGSDEACDGMGFEDCILGIRLANQGRHFQYDRRLMSYESEELHHLDQIMRRTDKGVSPNDKSHAILAKANATSRAGNIHLGPDGIEGLRRVYRETGEIPKPDGPLTDWYDGQSISEMT